MNKKVLREISLVRDSEFETTFYFDSDLDKTKVLAVGPRDSSDIPILQ